MKRNFLYTSLCSAALLAASCNKRDTTAVIPAAAVNTHHTSRIAGATMLAAPVAEAKVYKLLPGYNSSDDFEASGVYFLGGYFYIACDNMQKIPKIKSTMPINSSLNSLVSTGAPGSGSSNWESITYDNHGTANFYVVEESANSTGSIYQPRIYELDGSLNYQSRAWGDYDFTSATSNKAFEGIVWVYRGGEDYLICLVEGTGKMPVLKKTSGDWILVDSITLPSTVTFTDYAEICLHGDTVAILSQQDSQFWLGTLSSTSWSISGPGHAYQFPLGSTAGVVGAGDSVIYANVEGISFINDTQIVVCSDKAKSSQPAYQQIKDQSVHIFNLPH